MTAPAVGALLAAGHSRRFGTADKLLAPLNGCPLVCHAAAALMAMRPSLDQVGVVAAHAEVIRLLPAFDPITPAGPGMGDSLAAAARWAMGQGARCLLVTLGDMPRVPPAHLAALVAGRTDRPAASQPTGAPDLPRVMVPAAFPAAMLPDLAALSGDKGAQRLLRDAHGIPLDAGALTDIDRPEDLERLAKT